MGAVNQEPQPCPVHGVALKAGGYRVIVDGLQPLGTYYDACKLRFPRANALRIQACNGRLKGLSVASYCPECRKELAAWAQLNERHEPEAKLAQLLLRELFGGSVDT